MEKNPYTPAFRDLPAVIPVFPLTGVLLLPGGQLPLNIFEKRYLDMVDDAMGAGRMIGMIQPQSLQQDETSDHIRLCAVGCMGKITEFSETADGRYLITLRGISRFRVAQELPQDALYRKIRADWSPFAGDLENTGCLGLDRAHLTGLLESYFRHIGLNCDWKKVEDASDNHLITCLSMICPFDPREKQALLEAGCCRARAGLFMNILNIAVQGAQSHAPKTRH